MKQLFIALSITCALMLVVLSAAFSDVRSQLADALANQTVELDPQYYEIRVYHNPEDNDDSDAVLYYNGPIPNNETQDTLIEIACFNEYDEYREYDSYYIID